MVRFRAYALRKTRKRLVIATAAVAVCAFTAAIVLLQKAERSKPVSPAPANPGMGMLNRVDQAEAVKSSLNIQAWLKNIQAETASRRAELFDYATFREVASLLDSIQADPETATEILHRGAPALAALRDEMAEEADPAKMERNRLLIENLNQILPALR